jgi:cation transport ATPase
MVMSRTEEKLTLELPIILPEENDKFPRCAERLGEILSEQRGIEKTHLMQEEERTLLCLHYDPNLTSLTTVKRLAEEAGSGIGLAIVLHEGCTLLVVANALRLLRFRPE